VKFFEAHHWAHSPLDSLAVLLDDVVEVLALADFDTFLMISINLFQTCMIGSVLVNVAQTRFSVFLDGLPQKPTAAYSKMG